MGERPILVCMHPFNPFLLIVLVATLLEAAADILFKLWTDHGEKTFLLIGGIALYTVGTLIWAYSLRFEALSKAIVVFTVLNLILVVLAGLILFGEKLSLLSVIGIVLGAISVVLLQL